MLQAWSGWSPARKRVVALVAAGAAVALAAWSWLARPQFVPLYSRLDVQEAARVVEALQQMGVPYRLTGAGTTVEVPRERVYAARLQLAAQGLPRSGGVGFELFDRSSFGASELVQRVNLQRAVAGELVRSIETLDAVESARVHLAIPEDRLFRDEASSPSASVVVALRPGAGLSAGQVRAIRHLVASSVEGLSPERVTVVDTRGRLLSAGQEDPSGVNTVQLGEREQVEAALQQRVQSMLDEVLGPGKALARVSAEVDFSRRQVEQESFLPDQRAPTSEVTVEESYAGRGGLPPGGPATVSVPSYAQAPATASGSEYRRRESRTTYQVTRRVERAVSTGGIRRLSVAVLVDRRVPQAAVQALEAAVAAGLGLDRRRGDVLVVQAVDFPAASESPAPRAEAPTANGRRGVPLWLVAAAGGTGLLTLLAVVLVLLRRRRAAPVKVETLQPVPVAPAAPPAEEDEEERILRALREREEGQQAVVRRELQRMAQERPADIAAVIKSWIQEK
ncbi:MAG: flagellar basal-body MS-ring/collar protein FliF [Armatimonadota bacterium]|nr:flagellar basal-body MS-ring/collar protein FliF [Armatimonadota bacterium]MDR5690342.1 flagellar basal-body MS-ring/collar protein FliF [Armatimonadota bacterium]MDR7387626.1 flagellar basal-body MS-ring/collar protein FliF [Armatimonadota bacterium]MDR7396647.1 flagellar basal-body MS-ring/collar protein FliF [Armatimonadota bacterium]MDR7399066.1 flagellar basal-body MS-ring/collar protein FliF [Armatimonadota bacterium]